MGRHALIRDQHGKERVVPEVKLSAESELHDVLMNNPELLPADDLQLDSIAVFGREASMDSGRADLIMVDRNGQVCIVEVKKDENPDIRRVTAQLLDYAAALWRTSAEDFERDVLHPYLRLRGQSEPLPDLASFASEAFGGEEGEDEDRFEDFAQRLEQSLASGQFRLVVAAPDIAVGVQQVIEYLNSQGMLMYGLEVSCFGGEADTACYVPRLIAKPRLADTKRSNLKPAPISEEDLLKALPDRVRLPAQAFLRRCEEAGARIRWQSSGASIRVLRAGPEKVAAYVERGRFYVTVKPPSGYPPEPFEKARESLLASSVGAVGNDGWYSARLQDLDDELLQSRFAIALGLIEALQPQIDFVALPEPIESRFTRNDHNIWANAVPELRGLLGRWLRGELTARSVDRTVAVQLKPLARDGTGWQPRFASRDAELEAWPTGALKGDYQLRITDASSP